MTALGATGLLLLSTLVIARAAGASVVTDRHGGFALSLPAHWRQIPLSTHGGAVVQEATQAEPGLAAALDAAVERATRAHMRLFAVGPLTGRFFPSFNVGLEPAAGLPSGGALFAMMTPELKVQLTAGGATNLHLARRRLPFGRALQVRYDLPPGAAAPPVHGLQLYVPHGPGIYVLTFTSARAGQDRAVSRLVAARWRWAA